MSKAAKHYKNWLYQAPLGLILVGFGSCLIAEAAHVKFSGAPTSSWVVYGTAALSVFNAGLCFLGNAILERVRYEREKEKL